MRPTTVCLVLAGVLFAGCGGERPVPPELVDVWRTPAQAYRDRIFEIRDGWVVFGTGEHTSQIFEIADVESQPEAGGRVRHTLHYWTPDGERLAVELLFQPGRPDSLRVGRGDQTWVRQRDAHWLEKRS